MTTTKPLEAARPSVTVLAGIALLAAILSVARTVLIPIALAILLTFILAPAVMALQRRGLTRTVAVLGVVLAAFICVGGGVAVISGQLHQLAGNLPSHKDNVLRKIQQLKEGPGVFDELGKMIDEVLSGIQPRPLTIPVTVQGQKSGLETMSTFAEPVIGLVGSAGLVIALTVTMLLKREDLRNRVIRLAGHQQLTNTTRAIDEATLRISRYLIVQVGINAGFGAVLALGLAVVGIPYSVLWGILAMVVRFIPYVGTWLSAVPPLLVSIAVSDGWFEPIAVGLFALAIGLVVNYVAEPLLVSRTTGVSPVALVVSAAFWTWLWGPIGLILSTPLTVCLRVLGRYVPPLEFLDVLFGNEPPLDPRFGFYQRLLARDEAEAAEVVETFLEDHDRLELCEKLLLPTVVCVKEDYNQGKLSTAEVDYIAGAIGDLLEEFPGKSELDESVSARAPLVVGCPAKDEIDELALKIFQKLGPGCRIASLTTKLVVAEVVDQVRQQQPAGVLITAVPPGSLARVRYLCKRLRAEFPELRIAVGYWGLAADESKLIDGLRAAGASSVAVTMSESLAQLRGFMPFSSDLLIPCDKEANHEHHDTNPGKAQGARVRR